MENEFEHFAHVDITCVRGTVCRSASRTRLDASNDCPVSCLFNRTALALCHLHSCIVIKEARICLSFLNHLAALAYKFFRSSIPNSDCHYRLRCFELVCSFQAEIGQLVCSVFAVTGLSADDEDFPHRVACEGCRIPFISYFKYLACLKVEAFEHFKCLILREGLFVDYIFLVIRPHVLVESSETVSGCTYFDVEIYMYEPDGL